MALTSPGVIKTTNEILIGLAPEITMVKQFQFDISNEVADYGAKVRVPFITAGSAEDFDAQDANYAHATGSLSDVFVTLSKQPKVTIPVTQTDKLELPNDSFWGKAAEAGRNVIGSSISKEICGNFTAEKCLAGKITMASVTKNAIAKLRNNAASKGRIADYVLVLDGDYYADLISLLDSNVFGGVDPIQNGVIEKLYGFKSIVCSYDLPEGVKGALVPTDGLAVAVRPVAVPDPAAYPECGVVSDEQGFSLTALRFTDFATAKAFYNVTTLVGTDLLRKNETFYIANA